MKRLLITILLTLFMGLAMAATSWTGQPGKWQQQKSKAKIPATQYKCIKDTGCPCPNATSCVDLTPVVIVPPVVTPPVVVVPPVNTIVDVNDGNHMGMPFVDKFLVPIGAMSKNYIDLIDHQAGNVPKLHTGVEAQNGEFRVSCNFSHMLQDDPIVKFGQPGASHWHTFFGNSQADANSTTATLMASGSSSCDGGIMNRSAYWAPTVIDTRNGRPIAPAGGNFYYKTEHASNVQPVPPGLKMIAGDMTSSATQPYIHWWCADKGDNNLLGDQGYIPNCTVGNHLIAVINFPAYWNGKDLDSADHKSHMSYAPDLTHTVQLPDITYNIRYDVVAGDDTSKWRLSSDMYDTSKPGGYSLHADYLFGWTNDPVSGENFSHIFWRTCLSISMDCGNSLLGDGRQYYY